jgi:hypothetical protein
MSIRAEMRTMPRKGKLRKHHNLEKSQKKTKKRSPDTGRTKGITV